MLYCTYLFLFLHSLTSTIRMYVRGLRTKTSVFYRNICINSFDVIILTETWLLEGIKDSELFDDRYIIWRRDRDYSKTRQKLGGGVLIAVRKELSANVRSDWCSNAEDMWVTLTLQNQKPKVAYRLHLCTVYICDENLGRSMSDQLALFSENLSEVILNNPCDKFIVVGDFNMPNLKWEADEHISGSFVPNGIQGSVQSDFFDVINLCNLSQYNSIPNHNNNILDLVFSNSDVSVNRCPNPLVKEDLHHPTLCIYANFVQYHALK